MNQNDDEILNTLKRMELHQSRIITYLSWIAGCVVGIAIILVIQFNTWFS